MLKKWEAGQQFEAIHGEQGGPRPVRHDSMIYHGGYIQSTPIQNANRIPASKLVFVTRKHPSAGLPIPIFSGCLCQTTNLFSSQEGHSLAQLAPEPMSHHRYHKS